MSDEPTRPQAFNFLQNGLPLFNFIVALPSTPLPILLNLNKSYHIIDYLLSRIPYLFLPLPPKLLVMHRKAIILIEFSPQRPF